MLASSRLGRSFKLGNQRIAYRHRSAAMSSSRPARNSAEADVPPGYTVDKSVGPMYRFERSLPKLPVPEIDSTAQKYLDSVRPLVSIQEPGAPTASDEDPTPEWLATKKAVEEFASSPLVKKLQERLIHRATAEDRDSWLSDWWNEAAYMGYRDPVVPYVSYFYVHRDDRRMTENQTLEPEMAKKLPLAMASYRYLFNSCRYPVKPSDTAEKFDPEQNNHVAVVRKGHFFALPVVHANGDWLSVDDLEKSFAAIAARADELGPTQHPVGALTSENRDIWADARKGLVQNARNAESLRRIESAIIVVALDDNSPVTRQETSWNLWVGDGKNRFFDKHQIIVSDNGRSGFLGEHSCMDGTPTSRMNDWMLRSVEAGKIDPGAPSKEAPPGPQLLEFELSEADKTAVADAQRHHRDLMSKRTLSVLQVDAYGKDVIKQFKVSPDSWAQLTMQLAYFKLEGYLAPTYESAQTRKFRLGRTEVIRTATAEALEWCKAMEDSSVDNPTRLQLFKKAVAAHGKFAAWAADGQGVDRHLFGLKKLLKEGEELPALYTDPSYAKSGNWILSTSQLASEYFEGWGYGEVVPEGFGLAYAVNARSLRFTITATNGKTEKFRHYLQEAAEDVRQAMTLGSESKL